MIVIALCAMLAACGGPYDATDSAGNNAGGNNAIAANIVGAGGAAPCDVAKTNAPCPLAGPSSISRPRPIPMPRTGMPIPAARR